MIRILLATLVLSGCASTTVQPTVASNPISQIQVHCGYSTQMSQELQSIIDNPNNYSSRWDHTFSKLSGSNTPQARVASAKTVLWTIRTRCPGS